MVAGWPRRPARKEAGKASRDHPGPQRLWHAAACTLDSAYSADPQRVSAASRTCGERDRLRERDPTPGGTSSRKDAPRGPAVREIPRCCRQACGKTRSTREPDIVIPVWAPEAASPPTLKSACRDPPAKHRPQRAVETRADTGGRAPSASGRQPPRVAQVAGRDSRGPGDGQGVLEEGHAKRDGWPRRRASASPCTRRRRAQRQRPRS